MHTSYFILYTWLPMKFGLRKNPPKDLGTNPLNPILFNQQKIQLVVQNELLHIETFVIFY